MNIETTYFDVVRGSLDADAPYEPFPGLILTDTFQSWEDADRPDLGVFPENNERLERLKALDIQVIVGNPPYSSGQDSANDNNANEKYPALDAAIRDTYAARSTATNKNSLYDSYIRAIKWATLRIKDRGVIAYVTNGGWLDSNTADGMRLTLADEFTDIYVLNLRGNQRTAGEQSRKEGGKVFGGGSRATVAVTLLVKDPARSGPARVHTPTSATTSAASRSWPRSRNRTQSPLYRRTLQSQMPTAIGSISGETTLATSCPLEAMEPPSSMFTHTPCLPPEMPGSITSALRELARTSGGQSLHSTDP